MRSWIKMMVAIRNLRRSGLGHDEIDLVLDLPRKSWRLWNSSKGRAARAKIDDSI